MGGYALATMCRGCAHQKECNKQDSDVVIGICNKYKKDSMHDFAEVVRCKDCRYSHEGDGCYICRNPKGLPEKVFWFDFCSNGERRRSEG